jgi:queuine tRNA-ribosyltransferase
LSKDVIGDFVLHATSGGARRGTLSTAHGAVATPCFMPVGTLADVKLLEPRDLHELGARIVLANTYHLWLRPGRDTLVAAGGIHRFMAWDGPILTDSGGFQVFSLESRREVDEEA